MLPALTCRSIVKDTARRFAENEETIVTATDFDRELASNPANDFVTIDGDKAIYHNHWTAGGSDMKWEMIHYDVQLFGGVVLHQGKIAEMATGEGKTLVGTTPDGEPHHRRAVRRSGSFPTSYRCRRQSSGCDR